MAIYKINQSLDLFCWPYLAACRILVPQPGMEPLPPTLGAQTLNHWTTREVPTNLEIFALMCVCWSLSPVQLFETPMDCSVPGSSVHGILQARILEGVAISHPGDLPHPGIKPRSLALQTGFIA